MRSLPGRAALLSVLSLAFVSTLQAAPIGLNSLSNWPNDIASENVSINYSPLTGSFSADGEPITLDGEFLGSYLDGVNNFHLTATISQASTESPVLISNAALTLIGDPLGDGSGTTDHVLYSSANLKQFGYFSGTNSYWEFVFAGETGSLLTSGNDIGVILSSAGTNVVFTDFTSAFGTGSGVGGLADTFNVPPTFTVPEPASVTLLGLAGLALLARKKKP